MQLLPVVKSANPTCCQVSENSDFFVDRLLRTYNYDLVAYEAIRYANTCSAVGTAVDLISGKAASIKPRILDTETGQFINHKLDDLLKNPGNSFIATNDFIKAYLSFYIITGNNFLAANAVDKNSEPRNLVIYPPEAVNLSQTVNGVVEWYDVYFTNNSGLGTNILRYTSEYDANLNKYRYFAILPNGATSELFHSKEFNPKASKFGIYGKSILTDIYLEMEQQIASNKHNLSVLKRGTTVSGIFKNMDNLSEEQLDRLRVQISEHFGSEFNAGRPLLLNNNTDFSPNNQTNRDMDFLSLKKETKEAIYTRLHIPLPYINADTMTMANLDASAVSIYDDAVLPWVDRIFTELSTFLLPRYKNSEKYEIYYDESKIAALTTRRLEQLKTKQQLIAFTINEIRQEAGALTGLEGGESLYATSGMTPIADDIEDEFYTESSNDTPAPVPPAAPAPAQEPPAPAPDAKEE